MCVWSNAANVGKHSSVHLFGWYTNHALSQLSHFIFDCKVLFAACLCFKCCTKIKSFYNVVKFVRVTTTEHVQHDFWVWMFKYILYSCLLVLLPNYFRWQYAYSSPGVYNILVSCRQPGSASMKPDLNTQTYVSVQMPITSLEVVGTSAVSALEWVLTWSRSLQFCILYVNWLHR